MNNRQFLARQRVKYYWKALKHTSRLTGDTYRDEQGMGESAFWDYEPTPRKFE